MEKNRKINEGWNIEIRSLSVWVCILQQQQQRQQQQEKIHEQKKIIKQQQLTINAYYARYSSSRNKKKSTQQKWFLNVFQANEMCPQLANSQYSCILICNASFTACVVLTFHDGTLKSISSLVYGLVESISMLNAQCIQCVRTHRCRKTLWQPEPELKPAYIINIVSKFVCGEARSCGIISIRSSFNSQTINRAKQRLHDWLSN